MKKEINSQIEFRIVLLAGIMVMLCGLGMTGCGQKTPAEGDAGTYQPRERTEYDLASNQWKEQGETEDSGEPWQYTEYWESTAPEVPGSSMRRVGRWSAASGSDFYWLESYIGKEGVGPGARKCYLTCLDTVTMEAVRTEFGFTGISDDARGVTQELFERLARDLDENWLEIIGMDMQNGKICLLAAQMDSETKKVAGYYVIWTDTQGNMESAVDMFSEVKSSGMMKDGYLPEGILCGREGYVYIGTSWHGAIGIFDASGKFLKEAAPPDGLGSGGSYLGRLPDGRPIFSCKASDPEDTVLFVYEGLEEKKLYEGRCTISQEGYPNAYGEILFMQGGSLLRWDGVTGKCESLYREAGFASLSCEAIIENSAEEVVMVLYDGYDAVTIGIRLQLGAKMEETVLTLYQMSENQKLNRLIEEYNRTHPGVRVELTGRNKDDDDSMALTRLAAQLSKEDGPDLLVVSPEQLKLLQEKDALADLTGVLPKETEEQIFQGALRCGMVDGRLYGIANEIFAFTVAVSGKVWPEDTWTWKDVIELMERDRQKAGGFKTVFSGQSPMELLKFLVVWDVAAGTSSFLDPEKAQCYFDSEDFVRILEFCREYGSESGSGGHSFEEEIKMVQDGETLVYECGGSLMSFSRHMAALGEGYKCVGYPTEGEYGGYFECYDCICVNAGSRKQEMAYDVLQYLFSSQGQRKTGVSAVRKDVLSGYVEDGAQPGESPMFWVGSRERIPLEGKTDGSSFLPEYIEILEKGMYNGRLGTAELAIIEEAAAYFNGDKTAEEVADIIQSRVWLYLNEK